MKKPLREIFLMDAMDEFVRCSCGQSHKALWRCVVTGKKPPSLLAMAAFVACESCNRDFFSIALSDREALPRVQAFLDAWADHVGLKPSALQPVLPAGGNDLN